MLWVSGPLSQRLMMLGLEGIRCQGLNQAWAHACALTPILLSPALICFVDGGSIFLLNSEIRFLKV